jgi:hypothetical protein
MARALCNTHSFFVIGDVVWVRVHTGRYEGGWLEGRHHGLGVMLWPNGQKHDGGWSRGEMHGAGVHRWQNGTCREGTWKNGERATWTGNESFGLLVHITNTKNNYYYNNYNNNNN